jgi:DNA-binding winged helix-turn-helix (wHTH) protein/Tol biopolymer transport system component
VAAYSFGHFRLNVATRQLWKDAELVPLTAKAFDTLVVLVAQHGRVVTKEELMKAVWHDAIVSDDSLTQNIRAIRRALGDDAVEPHFVTTVARRGYRFIQAVEELADDAPGPAPATVPVPAVPAAPPARPGTSEGSWRAWVGGLVAGMVAAGLVFTLAWQPSASVPREILRFNVSPPPGTMLESGATVAPNGRTVAFVASDAESGRSSLWMTDFTGGQNEAIPGTDGASRPAWSPDGSSLSFFANGALRAVERGTGRVRVLAPVRNPGGASWATDRVLYADLRSAIWSVPAAGGEPEAVTALDASSQEVAHRWPHVLPGSRRFLYYIESADPAHAGTYVGEIGSSLKQRIFDVPAIFQDGHLVYVRERVLQAQRMDLNDYSLSGTPVVLASDAAPLEITTAAALSAGPGLLAYNAMPTGQRLTWFDRAGNLIQHIDGPAGLYNPYLLRDGSQLLAATGTGGGPRALWLIDLERGAPLRLAGGMRPLASPDGAQIAFTDDTATGIADVYVRGAGGDASARLLLKSPENKMVDDWSPDGQFLIVSSSATSTKADLWRVPLSGGEPQPLVRTAANELHGRLSPDGRWLAFASDETGALEVYVQSLADPGVRQTVSVGGGSEPRWRGDGRELFYLGADLSVMSVELSAGASLQMAPPRKLFRVPMARARSLYINHYDVAADGRRFVIQSAEQQAAPPLMVLLNWTALLPE